MDRHFVTPSGIRVRLTAGAWEQMSNQDAIAWPVEVSSTATTGPIQVVIDAPPLTSQALTHARALKLDEDLQDELAVSAVLHAIDQDPTLVGEADKPFRIQIDPGNVVQLVERPKLSDRELRRYIARRVHDELSRSDLDVRVRFDALDYRLTGAEGVDFLRNSQVLAEDGYLRIERAFGEANFEVQPTAKLVRDVEHFGSARDDAISESDYTVALNHPSLADRREALLMEYQRYSTARTKVEIESVFRSVAPIVEGLLRDVVNQRGVERDLPTLGPMIGEMQRRGIGDLHLYSQLNHILKFARDLEQHGGQLGEQVLRLACANAFELVPQIAALLNPADR